MGAIMWFERKCTDDLQFEHIFKAKIKHPVHPIITYCSRWQKTKTNEKRNKKGKDFR